jgi:hypothetical protein
VAAVKRSFWCWQRFWYPLPWNCRFVHILGLTRLPAYIPASSYENPPGSHLGVYLNDSFFLNECRFGKNFLTGFRHLWIVLLHSTILHTVRQHIDENYYGYKQQYKQH